MEEKLLHLGKMTNEEMAEWFGVTRATYVNSVTRYLKKLENYAKFKRVRGGVEVLEIYYSEYIKNYNFADGEYFNKEIERCSKEQDCLASISGIARKAKRDIEEFKELSDRQVERRFSDVALTHYGEYGDSEGGLTGVREREWAIKLGDYNEYRALSEEEYQLFVKIASIFYSKDAEKLIQKKKLEKQLKKGEISVKTYFDSVEMHNLDSFPDILQEFKAQTGYSIVLASKYLIKAF